MYISNLTRIKIKTVNKKKKTVGCTFYEIAKCFKYDKSQVYISINKRRTQNTPENMETKLFVKFQIYYY